MPSMMNQPLVKKTLFGFVLSAFLAFNTLQLSSCSSDDNGIEYVPSLDIGDTDSMSIDSLIIETEDSMSLSGDSLLTQFGHSLPVVKITIDEKYLWSEDSGLFVVNHPVLWEFPSQVIYIDKGDTIFDHALGLRLKGNYSINLPNRSMGLYWREKYGEKNINYPFFENYDLNKFKRLKLRNGGTDADQLLTKDAVLSKLIAELRHVEVANSRPVKVFINGDYWGLYNLRELITPRHFQYKYGLDNEQITMLQDNLQEPQVDDGDANEYLTTVLPFLETKDFSEDATVEQLFDQYMDKFSFIDYYAAEIYIGNWDWPLNNMKWWKSSESSNQKWQWIAHDLDMVLEEKHIEHIWIGDYYKNTDDIVEHHSHGFFMLNKLMENQQFRIDFFERFLEIIDHFSPEHFNEIAEKEMDQILPYYPDHKNKWNYYLSFSEWLTAQKKFKSLNQHRNEWIKPIIKDFLEHEQNN